MSTMSWFRLDHSGLSQFVDELIELIGYDTRVVFTQEGARVEGDTWSFTVTNNSSISVKDIYGNEYFLVKKGRVEVPTPQADDDSQKAASTAWVQQHLQSLISRISTLEDLHE